MEMYFIHTQKRQALDYNPQKKKNHGRPVCPRPGFSCLVYLARLSSCEGWKVEWRGTGQGVDSPAGKGRWRWWSLVTEAAELCVCVCVLVYRATERERVGGGAISFCQIFHCLHPPSLSVPT